MNNHLGIDSEPNEVGLMTTGDDLRLALRRIGGKFSLVVENLTRGSSNTLTVNHPAFLDQEPDLYAGVFGANTQSDVSKTLTISELKVTIWTRQPGVREAAPAAPPVEIGLIAAPSGFSAPALDHGISLPGLGSWLWSVRFQQGPRLTLRALLPSCGKR